MSNTFGSLFRLTTFGESHGTAVGGVVDGCPAGLELNLDALQHELDLRSAAKSGLGVSGKPEPGVTGRSEPGVTGSSEPGVTPRREPDRLRLLSGLLDGRTLGTPIAFSIENQQQNPGDYEAIKNIYRPGHADYAWEAKYGLRDWRGGGRSSGRETAARVAGGAIALQLLQHFGIRLMVYTLALGGIRAAASDLADQQSLEQAEARPFFAPADSLIEPWRKRLAETAKNGDSLGGLVRLEAHCLPPGLGEPVFDKLDARIGAAMFGLGAVKGVEIGAGFAAADLYGSQSNDAMLPGHPTGNQANDQFSGQPNNTAAGLPHFASNNSGGVLGGISNGQPLVVTVAVKPIPSIKIPQQTVDNRGQAVLLNLEGRHDVCAIPRINPALKAMLALTLADFVLLQRASSVNVL
ncbi:MAG: chorismate synthase [Deltaproteobacteria bacterium]|jgi:chorismate synthase|nr:chorismate synthase [Deltaproteobacteria bacterium]